MNSSEIPITAGSTSSDCMTFCHQICRFHGHQIPHKNHASFFHKTLSKLLFLMSRFQITSFTEAAVHTTSLTSLPQDFQIFLATDTLRKECTFISISSPHLGHNSISHNLLCKFAHVTIISLDTFQTINLTFGGIFICHNIFYKDFPSSTTELALHLSSDSLSMNSIPM